LSRPQYPPPGAPGGGCEGPLARGRVCGAPGGRQRYGPCEGETTVPLPLDARQMLESAGPVSNGNVTVFNSVELKASTWSMQLPSVKPGTVAPVQTLSASQQASSSSVSPAGMIGPPWTNAPAQLPPSCSVAFTFKRAAVHWRINCVSCWPRILPSVPTEQMASVVETVLPAATLVRVVPQTSSGRRSRLRGSVPVIRKG